MDSRVFSDGFSWGTEGTTEGHPFSTLAKQEDSSLTGGSHSKSRFAAERDFGEGGERKITKLLQDFADPSWPFLIKVWLLSRQVVAYLPQIFVTDYCSGLGSAKFSDFPNLAVP